MVKGVSDAAVKAAEEAERPEIDTVRLSSGIVLKVKPVPPYLVRQAAKNVVRPQPPKIKLREDRDIEEENPDDPEYQEALGRHVVQAAEAASDLMLMAGTELVSLSDGQVPPESDEWLELVQFVGVEVDWDSKFARYLAWVKFYAIMRESDLALLLAAVGRGIGLSEKEVDQAVDSFRGGEVGGADNGVPPADAGNGDSVPTNRAGRRARDRRKRSGQV